jgi:hypothetical protein
VRSSNSRLCSRLGIAKLGMPPARLKSLDFGLHAQTRRAAWDPELPTSTAGSGAVDLAPPSGESH